jgi:phosphoribosylaminoimidazole-succinocarboxamide synthase
MFASIQEVVSAGIWPASKKLTEKQGLPSLEALGYKLFYVGKNADLYFVPGEIPGAIAYRSDRTSVFNIELDLEIKGKGIIQSQISHKCFDFIERLGIKTARLPLPENIPQEIAERCMAFELCSPFEITLPDGQKTGLEMIFRKYLTGSLYKKYYTRGLDPYNLKLKKGLDEWTEFDTMIFTPTTKCTHDYPINHEIIRKEFPEVVGRAEKIFKKAFEYCYQRLYVMPDGKLEFFINSKDEIVLGDEALTPESSRYITLFNFERRVYIPADKQIIRNYAEEHGWEAMAENLAPGEKLKVVFPEEQKKKVLFNYSSILELWL